MPITPEHAFKEKSTKSLISLPLRTIYNRTFQYETPCILCTLNLSLQDLTGILEYYQSTTYQMISSGQKVQFHV